MSLRERTLLKKISLTKEKLNYESKKLKLANRYIRLAEDGLDEAYDALDRIWKTVGGAGQWAFPEDVVRAVEALVKDSGGDHES